MPVPEDINRHLTGHFKHSQAGSCCAKPCNCLFFSCCQPCALYAQRKEVMEITKEPYVCCGGTHPCCGWENPAPEWCLALEVCCFPASALAANRFLVQTRFNKKNTGCDSLLRICHICVACEFCCMRCCMNCSKERENLVKAGCGACTCTYCQNAVELSELAEGVQTYQAPSVALINELPVHYSKVGITVANAPVQMKPM